MWHAGTTTAKLSWQFTSSRPENSEYPNQMYASQHAVCMLSYGLRNYTWQMPCAWHYKHVCMHGMMLSHSFHNRGIRGQSLLVDFLGYKTAWVWDYITVFCFWVTPTFLSGWVNKGNYLYLCSQLERNVGVTAVGNHRGNSLEEIGYAYDIAISVSLKDQYLFTKNVHSLFPGMPGTDVRPV